MRSGMDYGGFHEFWLSKDIYLFLCYYSKFITYLSTYLLKYNVISLQYTYERNSSIFQMFNINLRRKVKRSGNWIE